MNIAMKIWPFDWQFAPWPSHEAIVMDHGGFQRDGKIHDEE
jgi:hypothetical protein